MAIEAIQSRFAKEARSSEGGSGSASGKRGASASPAGSSPSQPEIVPDKVACSPVTCRRMLTMYGLC